MNVLYDLVSWYLDELEEGSRVKASKLRKVAVKHFGEDKVRGTEYHIVSIRSMFNHRRKSNG